MEELADSALVDLARDGDGNAFAELYQRYFDPVYDFVARMTRDRDEAADIAQDTFLKAMGALGGFRQGASFRSWVFTIARNTTLNRLERASRTRPLTFDGEDGEPVDMAVVDPDRFADPAEAAEAAAMAGLVWEAAAGLDPKQLTLLDLHLRQGLDGAEIAQVLGVTRNNGYVMLNRLKRAVEDAIGAFIVWKDGPRYCKALAAELAEARSTAMSPAVRRLVGRHVGDCEECEERKRRLVSPLAAFGAFAAVGSPAGVKAHILEGLMKEWPGAAVPAAEGSGGAGPPGRGAAPGAGGEFPSWGLRLLAGAGAAAALLFGALVIPASPIAITGGDGGGPPAGADSPTAVVASPSPAATATPGTKSPVATASQTKSTATPQKTATAGASGTISPPPVTPTVITATASPSPAKTATATATVPPPPPTQTPTTVPCTPSLATNVGSLVIAPGGTQTFLAYDAALCGPLPFTAAASDTWIVVNPASGTIGTGGAIFAVQVSAAGLSEGRHTGSVTVSGVGQGGSATVYITMTVAGSAPAIERATGSCPVTAGQWSFAAYVTDDHAVARVKLRYISPGGEVTLDMSGPAGAPEGDWTLSIAPVPGASGFVIVATDAAGQQASAPASGNCG